MHRELNKAPKEDGICDKCKGTLIKRSDENLETIIERLKGYNNNTAPLKQYYIDQNKLVFIDGNGTIENIQENIIKDLSSEE